MATKCPFTTVARSHTGEVSPLIVAKPGLKVALLARCYSAVPWWFRQMSKSWATVAAAWWVASSRYASSSTLAKNARHPDVGSLAAPAAVQSNNSSLMPCSRQTGDRNRG